MAGSGNHYADDVAKFLLDGRGATTSRLNFHQTRLAWHFSMPGLPSSIVNVAEEALSTPQGQAVNDGVGMSCLAPTMV